MNIVRATKVIQQALERGIPIMVWGAPGIGKSSAVKQIAAKKDAQAKAKDPKSSFEFVDLRLPQLDPTDIRGIPVPNRETGVCKWYIPEFLPTSGSGILFLDEIEKASPAVKNAALQLVLDRQIGSYRLPDGWGIVAAGNREEDGAFSQPMGSALGNRMGHIEVSCDADTWLAWARESKIIADIIGYIEFRKLDALCPPRKAGNGASISGRLNAFPTPRSWEMASRLVAGVDDKHDRRTLVSSAVGEAMANEFMVWADYYRSVDPVAIIEKGEMPDKNHMKEISSKYAIAMSCAAHVSSMKEDNVKECVKNMAIFVDKYLTPDVKIVFFRNIPFSYNMLFSGYPSIMAAIKDVIIFSKDA